MRQATSHLGRSVGGVRSRGMTLLEVVVAVLILGLVASAVSSVLAYVVGQTRYNTIRLGAFEVANRIMIQYLDDDSVIQRTQGRPIEYDGKRYDWDCNVDRVTMNIDTTRAANARFPSNLASRFELVTIRVWDAPRSGLRGAGRTGEPLANVTRLVDPGFLARNPDSGARLVNDPARLVEYSRTRLGFGLSGGPSGAASPQGNGRSSGGSR